MKTRLAPRSAATPSHHQVASKALEAVGLLQLLSTFDGTKPLLVEGEKLYPRTGPADWQATLLDAEKVIRDWLFGGGPGKLLLSIPRPARQAAMTIGGESHASAHEAAVGHLMKMVSVCKEQLADDLEASPSSWPSELFTDEAAARMAERLPRVSPEDIDRLQVELDLERDHWAANAAPSTDSVEWSRPMLPSAIAKRLDMHPKTFRRHCQAGLYQFRKDGNRYMVNVAQFPASMRDWLRGGRRPV